MSDLFIELFSEEIPARMQRRAADDLARFVLDGLAKAGIARDDLEHEAHVTARRLSVVVSGLPAETPAKSEERKGPRVGSPDKAIEGFLRGAGLSSIDEAEVRSDPKKGDFYVAVLSEESRPLAGVVASLLPDIITNFPWPKSMRWGSGALRWVRPLQRIVCLFDGAIVPFEVDGITSAAITEGHRFMAPEPFEVDGFDGYRDALQKRFVILSHDARQDRIREQARACAQEAGLSLVEDDALVAENAGLNEWPTVLMGAFDETFLAVPDKVLVLAMKDHQKCFSLASADGGLANRFLLVTNIEAEDGGAEIIAGNERVINARLSDATFFWNNDLKTPLENMAAKLSDVTFHAKLGTQAERVERIARLARDLSSAVDADADLAEQAARLAKADLMSETVYETPELQGYAGRHLAIAQGLPELVAVACEAHYRPVGASDAVPDEPVSIAVALADKLDMLASFWAIDEKPTGSGDPYALRRAALGVIRIVLEHELTVKLPETLLEFFADRLKVYLRDRGARHDLIDAVFALGDQDDLLLIVRRVEALGRFLDSDDGETLQAGIKRASNILRIEEKKDKARFDGEVDISALQEPAEKDLVKAIAAVQVDAGARIEKEDFEGAMAVLAKLRQPVDAFFDQVTVNAGDPALRANRLRILNSIREATRQVADFSKLAG